MAGYVLLQHSAASFCRAALRIVDAQHYLASSDIALPSSPLSPGGVQTSMTSKRKHYIYGCLHVQESQAAPIASSKDCCSRHVSVLFNI